VEPNEHITQKWPNTVQAQGQAQTQLWPKNQAQKPGWGLQKLRTHPIDIRTIWTEASDHSISILEGLWGWWWY